MTDLDPPAAPPILGTGTSDQFRLLVESVVDYAIFLLDPAGNVTSWNPGAERIKGYKANEIVGRHFSVFYPAEDVAAGKPQRLLERALADGHVEEEGERLRSGGLVFRALVTITALRDATGSHVGFAKVTRDLSESRLHEMARLEAERSLRSERAFSETMLESMPGILYFYDGRGSFLRWNRNFEQVSGHSGDEIARMHPLDFFRGDDRARVADAIANVFGMGEAAVEARFVSKDGTETPYFFTGRHVLYEGISCLVGVGIDVSERRLAEERLARSEREYRELVEHANSIILRWDDAGRITFLNEFGLRFFGYEAAEIVGQSIVGTIVPPTESSGRDLRLLMQQIQARPEDFEFNINQNIRRNGERVWVFWTNRVVRDEDGSLVEIFSIGSDITARLKAESEREKRERAEEADRIKSAFLATMSHELRTPLNSIIGFTGIMLQGLAGPLNEEQHKQLDMVRGSARHLLALVNDVLDISKIEAGQLVVSRAPFDPLRSVAKVTALVRPLAAAKALDLRVDLPADLGEAVGDQRRFEQILLNLLSNAIKFTDRGSVTLEAALSDGASGAEPGRPSLQLRVTDTGIGIRAEDLPALFQPFSQVETGLARNREGTGLGLAICRRLATLMGGEIRVESEWKRGSTFTLVLPLEAPVATPPPRRTPPAP
jgi:PAS domain S-box-containing protein